MPKLYTHHHGKKDGSRRSVHGTMHSQTVNDSPPLCKLIRRACVFSDFLCRASSTRRAITTDGDDSSRFNKSVVYHASLGEDQQDEQLMCLEHPRDFVQQALLQELFFPTTENPKLVHSDTGSLARTSLVSLSINVGKLLFCQPFYGDVEACLLIVRAIRRETLDAGCRHEQCMYTKSAKVSRDHAVFDHQFKIFMNISLDVLDANTWNEYKMLEVTVHVLTQSGEPILQCNGYLYLWDILRQTACTHQTHIVLVNSEMVFKNDMQDREYNPCKLRTENHARRQTSRPLGILGIELKIVRALSASRFAMSEISEENWFYVYVHIGTSVMEPDTLKQKSKSLMLIIKAGNRTAVRFVSMSSDSNTCLMMQTVGDAIVKAPNLAEKTAMYIEIWCNNNSNNTLKDMTFYGLENLCGLVKVPLPATLNGLKASHRENIVDGDFLLWHSEAGLKQKKVRVTIYMGQKVQMLNVLKETRAAVTIQRYSRYFLERLHNLNSTVRMSKTKDLLAKHVVIQRDVFEVTVIRAKNIPVPVLSRNDGSTDCREVFIKYVFPGEDEPLFTHDAELEKTIAFGATAHHRITLPQDRSLFDYLESLDKDKSCLRFELWTYISAQESKVQTQSEYYQVSSDKIQSTRNTHVKQKEKCIGIAELLMKDLLGCFKLTTRKQISLKVTRLFNLPITFQKWLKVSASADLIVQISYESFELAENLLLDSIFSIYSTTPVKSVFPLRATLNVFILDVVIQDTLKPLKHPPYWSIRLSLFPFNQDLQQTYPPIMKTWTKDSRHLHFRMDVLVDALVVKEMQQSFMTLELWNHRHMASTRGQEDSWVGVSMVPCVVLISRKQGLKKKVELTGCNRQPMGFLEVSIKLSDVNNQVQ